MKQKQNQMSYVMLTLLFGLQALCMDHSTDQRKIPVCLRQMAGLQCLCQCS